MERLFNNQIRPQAQPISSFVQPQQFRRANASQPSLLGNVSTIVQAQQQSGGSVQGFNQMEQLANSLAPFSKQLTKGIDRGFKLYATSNIEAGYYEEARNEAERARLQMQINQEKGAEEAAALQTQLEKMDPVGASLLREANPWKAIGRRRALAQLAAGQVSTVLDGDLANNAGELSGIEPGSPELGDRKMRLTQQVYQRFGLTGSELEANYYVTPEVNKQWDKYTQTQRKYYTEEINRTTIQATVAALNSRLDTDYRDGVLLDTGERVMPGDPRWVDQVGLRLTKNIDDGLAILGGEDKTKALEAIRQNLGLIAAEGQPAYEDAIGAIRLGRKGDKTRPLWRDANPYTLKNFTNDGLKLSNETYRQEQESIDQKLDSLWNEKVGGLVFGSPEYQAAVKEIEQEARGMGKGDVEGWLQDRTSEDREIAEAGGGVNPITTEERFAFDETLQTLTPDDFRDPQKLNNVFAQARALARREPTPERAFKAWTDYRKRIEAKQKEAASLPVNSRFDATISDQLKIDLQDPAIAALQGRVALIPGVGITRPNAPTASEQEFARFESNVRQMITNESFDLINEWQNKNPSTLITPQDVRSLIRQAAKNVRRSELYQQAYNIATTGDKDGKPAATQGQNQPAQNNQSPASPNTSASQGPVSRGQETTITPTQAKEYKGRPLMNSQWIYNDLKQAAENPSDRISPELQALSKKAGVHPYRMLIEQLKFYETLDPDGEITRWFEENLRQIKEGNTSAVPYGLNREVAQGSRAPGAWLTAMTLPVQLNA